MRGETSSSNQERSPFTDTDILQLKQLISLSNNNTVGLRMTENAVSKNYGFFQIAVIYNTTERGRKTD